MDTPSCTADIKLTMMKSKDSRLEIAKSATQFSLMIIFEKVAPNFGHQITQKFNQQSGCGNQNNQTPYRQTGCNSDGNRNPNFYRQYPQDISRNFWTNGPNNRQQTQYNFNARPKNSVTQSSKNF